MFRILHLIDSLGSGGTEHQLVLNASGLNGDQFENIVCYLHLPNDLESALDRNGIPAYGLGLTRNYQWVRGVNRLRKLIKSLNIDLIHTNLYEADVIGGIAGRLTKRPVISTIANVCFESEFLIDNPKLNSAKMEVSRLIRSVVAHTCNSHFVSVSQTVADSAARRLKIPPSKNSVIYRGLAESHLSPPDQQQIRALRIELGLSDAWPVLLNVGRLVPQKGQAYLIEAMANVTQVFPNARLLIAGDGYLKTALLDQRERLGLESQVTLLGHRCDIKHLLGMADTFVLPSLFEGCPNALIEAMAMGKPCVASRIGPVEEVIEDGITGVLVPSRSSEELAKAIIEFNSPSRERASQTGCKAKKFSRERFTIETAVEKLSALYGSVISDYYGLPQQVQHVCPGK